MFYIVWREVRRTAGDLGMGYADDIIYYKIVDSKSSLKKKDFEK